MIDIVASSSCVTEKHELFFILILFFLVFVNIILIKIHFYHFISLNIKILLCLRITNLSCNKILTRFPNCII